MPREEDSTIAWDLLHPLRDCKSAVPPAAEKVDVLCLAIDPLFKLVAAQAFCPQIRDPRLLIPASQQLA